MALRGLVEGECGAANPLVQWTSHFSQEKSMLGNGLENDRLSDLKHHGRSLEDQMVNEFLGEGVPLRQPAVPQTFNMASLLSKIQTVPHQSHHLQSPQTLRQPPQQRNALHDDVRVKEWVEEFSPAAPVEARVSRPQDTKEEVWVRELEQHRQEESETWAREFAPTEDEKWVAEFEDQMRSSDGRDLQSVARDMTQAITDPDIQESEFMDFVKKLASGELSVDDKNEVVVPKNGEEWVEQFEKEAEFGATANGGFWDRLEKEWEEMAKQETHPWLQEFSSFQKETTKEYQFQEDNPLREIENPLEEGLKRLKEGDLPSAVLLFEAEVQARPDSVQGWQFLGSTQADNEQDVAAIAALNKCLELDPGNLPAHMSLAVCYTNESQQIKALESLRGWLKHHTKYSILLPSEGAAQSTTPFIPSFMSKEEHAEVRDLFLKAAQISPEQVDADIQVGLGVLFNLSSEYDKAVDCFSAALAVRPDDAMLWNKLGATLANSNKSGEAVEAYRKALEYLPGFTRSRYNLGVSCINLGAYKEAVEHFLIALNMQRQAKGPGTNRRQMSDSIWSTLRLAITFVGRQELNKLVEHRDLDGLMREFSV